MWEPENYHLNLVSTVDGFPSTIAKQAFDRAWRTDFSAPGFCVLDLGPRVDSHRLRALMLELKDGISTAARGRGGEPFAYRTLGRFDQQVTTKFHLDGAPDRSLLMLGYEPSEIPSRLAMADYTRCAHDLGIEPKPFLDEYNPMYRRGEAILAPYVTHLPPPAEGYGRIVLVNNSSLPFSTEHPNPLGVLHQAEIPAPDPTKRRVINSIMLRVGDAEDVDPDLLAEFVATEAISGNLVDPGRSSPGR